MKGVTTLGRYTWQRTEGGLSCQPLRNRGLPSIRLCGTESSPSNHVSLESCPSPLKPSDENPALAAMMAALGKILRQRTNDTTPGFLIHKL